MASEDKQEIKNRTGSPLTRSDYEKLGQQLESLFINFDPSRRKIFWVNFWLGVLRGFGAVIGATVGIAILIYILSLFSQIPLIGPFVNNIKHTVNTTQTH